MKLVVVESPYKDIPDGMRYLAWCLLDCYHRGESPYASHAIGPMAMSESPECRALGLAARDAWATKADLIAIYEDLGVSSGCQRNDSVPVVRRKLPSEMRVLYQDGLWPNPAHIYLFR